MSMKEEKCFIFDDSNAGRLFIANAIENGLLISDSRMLTDKTNEENTAKKDFSVIESKKTLSIKKMNSLNDYLPENSFNCLCQNKSLKCKSVCITCESPCLKCKSLNLYKNSSTDTDDFDRYLENQFRKIKSQPKIKTIGIDTCDLEGHFDYYRLEKRISVIQKNVATDCADLNVRKLTPKSSFKNSVATDTIDLMTFNSKLEANEDSDCEFFWTKNEEKKTYKKKSCAMNPLLKCDKKDCKKEFEKESLMLNDDSSLFPSLDKQGNDKENFNIDSNSKNITFDSTSTSDESDIDLITSCKLSKCRQLAKKHKIILKQFSSDNGVSFKCTICEKTFQKKYLGTLHVGSHVENNMFKCLSCSKQFKCLNLLTSHVQNVHSNDTNEKKTLEVINSNVENENNCSGDIQKQKVSKIYKCGLCSNENESIVQFDSYKSLCLHKKLKHSIGKSKTVENGGKVKKKSRIKQEFVCLICGKEFKSSKALKDHSPVHTGEKNHHCDICKKSYTTSANLKIHKRTHTGTRNFVCSVCGKAFHKKDSLKVHFRKHSGERPFQCDLCPMRFDRNYILKNHRYTHFSEKTFICPVCGKTFTTHGGLNNHEKGHRRDPFAKKPRKPAVKPTLDAENAVICDVCGKIYSTKSNLRIHKFVHLGVKPFECPICHQTYAKKDSMLTHMRKHTGDRPFGCETCGMTFYRNHTLKTHLLRHTGERPHKCKICGKCFTQSSSLAYHVKNHDRKSEKKKCVPSEARPRKKRTNQTDGKLTMNPTKTTETTKTVEETTQEIVVAEDTESSLKDAARGDGGGGDHFLIPVPEKEILLLDKNLSLELPRTVDVGKEMYLLTVEKDGICNGQLNLSKYHYCIAKSQVLSFPKEGAKPKSEKSGNGSVENSNGYVTREESSVKEEEEFAEIKDHHQHPHLHPKLDLKSQSALPAISDGEILSAAYISDSNGEVIPFNSMTLQTCNADNVMIGPVISLKGND